MPFRDREWEDMQRDCSFFPAYTDYLFGLDDRPGVAEEPGLHPSFQLPAFEPIRNSTGIMGVDPSPMTGLASHGLAVNPRASSVARSIPTSTPTQVMAPVLQNTCRTYPAILSREQAGSSAQCTRRRLFEASQQQQRSTATSAAQSSQRFLRNLSQQGESNGSPEQRIHLGRPATLPPSVRSSSATDVDSEVRQMPTSTTPMSSPGLRVPPTQHAVRPQQPQHQHSGWTTNLDNSWQNPFISSSGVKILRPGDLLADPHYSAAFGENLQSMEATITQLWNIVQQHPDETTRKQALTRIQAASARVNVMIQKWHVNAQVDAQARVQSSAYNLSEMQQTFAHPQEVPDSYAEQPLRQQQYPVQDHVPQQSSPLHCDNSVFQGLQQPQHGLPLEDDPVQHMHNHQVMSGAQQLQHSLPLDQHLVKNESQQTPGKAQTPYQVRRKVKDIVEAGLPNYLAARRVLSTAPNNPGIIAEQEMARAFQASFRSQLGPDGQQYLVDIIAKIDASRQAASQQLQHTATTGQQSANPFIKSEYLPDAQQSPQSHIKREQLSPALQLRPQPLLQPPQQPQQPVQSSSPHEAQRNHIRSLVPKFLGALRIAQTPIDPADHQAAQLQQNAHVWMGNFKASLSPQGHAMLDEIVGNMMKAQNESRNWTDELKKM